MKRILFVATCVADIVRLFPVFKLLHDHSCEVLWVTLTSPDTTLASLHGILSLPDESLEIMEFCSDYLTQQYKFLEKAGSIISARNCDMIIIHGDSPATFAMAYAAYCKGKIIVHSDAGWDVHSHHVTNQLLIQRKMLGLLATYHCAATPAAAASLLAQGVHREFVFCVGDTAVDFKNGIYEYPGISELLPFIHELSSQQHDIYHDGEARIRVADVIERIIDPEYAHLNATRRPDLTII